MRSNYKRIGNFIRLVDERNRGLKVNTLLGLSISKEFIPSVANTIGTDMENYRIIRKGQFACSTMQVRRDKKMPVALLTDFDEAIISAAYPVFEIIDTDELLPEYLMMWFTRKEFDREACFYAVGGVRGSLEWDDFCDMELPVPHPDTQRAIVKEYNTIVNRIKLNEQLCARLEETAQAIYKLWFVDFEFPDKNGQPYKSSGGEMEYCKELEMEMPRGWEVKNISQVVKCNASSLPARHEYRFINYLDTSSITNNEIEEIQHLTCSIDEIPSRAKRIIKENDIVFSTIRPNLKHFGIIKKPKPNLIASTGFAVLTVADEYLSAEHIYLLITSSNVIQDLQARAEMSVSTYPSINPEDILGIRFVRPSKTPVMGCNKLFTTLFELDHSYKTEKKILKKILNLLLSRLSTIEK
jgi:type I restriction enzyme S subunit